MKRILISAAVVAGLVVIFGLMILNLESEPAGRADLAAIVLGAPDRYFVQDLGSASFASAAAVLNRDPGGRTATRFIEHGDAIILFADRSHDRIVEMRASRTGTVVERHWQGEIDRRLVWAAEHGDLNTPGLGPPTGKNLYH